MAGLVQVSDDDEQRVWRGYEGGERERTEVQAHTSRGIGIESDSEEEPDIDAPPS